MGYSITVETSNTLARNRREGVLCSGGARHCTTKAKVSVTTETWLSLVNVGESHVSSMKLCARHARDYKVGYAGVNFIVTGVQPL